MRDRLARKRWRNHGRTAVDRVRHLGRRAGKGIEVATEQAPAMQALTGLGEQRAGAGAIAVGEVLEADRRLDQSLQRLARVVRAGRPVWLQELVDLEVQPRVE